MVEELEKPVFKENPYPGSIYITEGQIYQMQKEHQDPAASGITEPGWYFFINTQAHGPYDTPEDTYRELQLYGQNIFGGLEELADQLKGVGIRVRHVNRHDDEVVLNNRFSVRFGSGRLGEGNLILSKKYFLGDIRPKIWDYPMRDVHQLLGYLTRKKSKVLR